MNERLETWILEHIQFPWYDFWCSRGYHKLVWENFEGTETCFCGRVLEDWKGLYDEQ